MAGRRGNGEGSIYKRKDGRWVASWTERTADGTKRRTAYAATQKAAKDKLKQAVRRMDDGLPSVDSTMTYSAWVEHWKTYTLKLSGLDPKSQRVYIDVLDLHVIPVIGETGLGDVRATHVEMVLSKMADKGLSPSYRHQAWKAMSKSLKIARRDDLIARNPMDGVAVPRGGQKDPVVPTREQVLALIAAAPDARMRAFIATLAYTGTRISEALSIQWADVDLEANRIRILKAKGGKPRAVPITAGLRVELVAWRKAQNAQHLASPVWLEGSDWVLASDHGTQWDAHNARKLFRPIAKDICPGLTPHGLRHATATMLLEEGVPMKVVSELLGHSSTRITSDLYSHVTDRLVKEAGDALDRALGG